MSVAAASAAGNLKPAALSRRLATALADGDSKSFDHHGPPAGGSGRVGMTGFPRQSCAEAVAHSASGGREPIAVLPAPGRSACARRGERAPAVTRPDLQLEQLAVGWQWSAGDPPAE